MNENEPATSQAREMSMERDPELGDAYANPSAAGAAAPRPLDERLGAGMPAASGPEEPRWSSGFARTRPRRDSSVGAGNERQGAALLELQALAEDEGADPLAHHESRARAVCRGSRRLHLAPRAGSRTRPDRRPRSFSSAGSKSIADRSAWIALAPPRVWRARSSPARHGS